MQTPQIEDGISSFASRSTLRGCGNQPWASGSPGQRSQLRKGAQNLSMVNHGQKTQIIWTFWKKHCQRHNKPRVLTYLIFAISFTQAKFSENKIYTEKRVHKRCQLSNYYTEKYQFCVHNGKIYTGQKKFTVPVTNMRYVCIHISAWKLSNACYLEICYLKRE